jgi:hypothetical protein
VKPELKQDEEHSTWVITYHDSTNAERQIGIELAARPEYKRLRTLAKQIGATTSPRSRWCERVERPAATGATY